VPVKLPGPPWRWPRGYLATNVVTDAIYAVAVGVVADRAPG
jgi:hypothetical protein